MDKIFLTDALKSIVNFKLLAIDNVVFRLHYLVTSVVLFVLSITVTLTQYFGEPISCIQRDDIPEKVINTYCWIESTFSLPKSLHKRVGDEIVYPGVERYKKDDEVIEHAYYQWVCFMLFLHGIMFYVTRALWEAWEGGKINKLVMELYKPLLDNETRNARSNLLCSYFCNNLRRHNCYAIKYYTCEVLNFINVIGQMYLMDRFLGGEFTTYGREVFQFMNMDQGNRTDPMIKVFPRITKCTFHKFGSAGSVQTHDSLCILSLNIVNEKIYVFLWLWLIILAILSGLAVVYRILVIMLPAFQCFLLKHRNRFVPEDDIEKVMKHINFGDWFVLHLLSKNIHSLNFRKFMALLAEKLGEAEILNNEKRSSGKHRGKLDYSALPLESTMKNTFV